MSNITKNDAELILKRLEVQNQFLTEAGVHENNPDKKEIVELISKLQNYSPDSTNINLAEEAKQFRVLLCLIMASIGEIEIDLTAIQQFGNDPNAFKVDINPSTDGSKVTIKSTGTKSLPIPSGLMSRVVSTINNLSSSVSPNQFGSLNNQFFQGPPSSSPSVSPVNENAPKINRF